MATSKKTSSTIPGLTGELPSLADLTKLAEQFKLPGVDVSALVEWQRKDLEALAEANPTPTPVMRSGSTCQRRDNAPNRPQLQPAAANSRSPSQTVLPAACSRPLTTSAKSPPWRRRRAPTPGRWCRTACRKTWPTCRS